MDLNDIDKIEVLASINRISTTIDGGWRITFDCGDDASASMLLLGQLREHILKLTIDIAEQDD